MNKREVSFSHPHDHFELLHITEIPNTCFVLMPFDGRFKIVYETLVRALKGLMIVSRADDPSLGKSILERILFGITSAEFIIADLTDKNANVFYELGLAHVHTKNVLLLAQDISDVPFDLRGLFCHTYSPSSSDGLKQLAKTVRKAALEVRALTVPAMLQGARARTQQIIEYMENQLRPPLNPKGTLVRVQAGFSSIANVGFPNTQDEETVDYGRLLERERDHMIQMLSNGAILRAIIFPPVGPWVKRSRWYRRYESLLSFLGNDLSKQCEFVISTEEGPNLLFFDSDILFEGHKTGIEAGYGWTMVYTDKNYLKTRLTIFDMLFQSARRHTLKMYGGLKSGEGDQKALREAVIKAIKMARDGKISRSLLKQRRF